MKAAGNGPGRVVRADLGSEAIGRKGGYRRSVIPAHGPEHRVPAGDLVRAAPVIAKVR